MSIGLLSQFFNIFTTCPLLILPCKDTLEELIYGKRGERVTDSTSGHGKMGRKVNLLMTFLLCAVTYGTGISLSSIGDALTIVGSTVSPTVGYIMPAVFYLRCTPKSGWLTIDKLLPLVVIILVVALSGISLANFFLYKEG
jgi:amino acid permease